MPGDTKIMPGRNRPKEHHHRVWTHAMDIELATLMNEGLSFGNIALRMGMGLTRHAVIGRAHRLGLRSQSERDKFLKSKVEQFFPEITENIIALNVQKGMCVLGCGKTAQRGYSHGLCAECNSKRLNRILRAKREREKDTKP